MFQSDNAVGAIPEVVDALQEAARRNPSPYGSDELDKTLQDRLCALFEHPLQVFSVATGTAANALALSAASPPWGAIYCHPEAHPNCDECGAPEAMSTAKLVCVDGEGGRIEPSRLRTAIHGKGNVHRVQPAVLSLSQSTECGTVYSLEHIAELTSIAHQEGLVVHLDGARFANALVELDCSAAEMSWRAGVDLLSFGMTKNGALCAELLLLFDGQLAQRLRFLRKRFGHMFSKSWFVSAQALALLEDDRWRSLALHANQMAERLAVGLSGAGFELLWPRQANAVFLRMPSALRQHLRSAGFAFYDWPGVEDAVRLICSFRSTPDQVDALLGAVHAFSCEPRR